MPARPKRQKPRATVRPDSALRSRARKILNRLAKAYPDWGPTLRFSSPLELLVATILAAQAQDERINEVTRILFTKYRGPADYAAAPAGVLERDIKATGFFNQKAKSLRAMARGLLDEFGGEVPSDMDGLTRLHGVGRKTASIVLGAAFGVPAVAVARRLERRRRETDGLDEHVTDSNERAVVKTPVFGQFSGQNRAKADTTKRRGDTKDRCGGRGGETKNGCDGGRHENAGGDRDLI